MSERFRSAVDWFVNQSAIVKGILIAIALVVAVRLSGLVAVLAALVLLVSLFVLVLRLIQRGSLRGWGITAATSLALLVVFGSISGAANSPVQEPSQDQASTPEVTQEATRPTKNTEAEAARQEAEEARQEAEEAKEQAAQAKREAEEAEAAKVEAQSPSKDKSSSSDGNTETVTIRVTGTPGIAFSGSYGNLDSTRTVDGVTPAEYETEIETGFLAFDSVTAVMQKRDFGSAELRVEMIVDGEVVKEESTTAEFGLAQVNYVPGE